jgi:hypothetical protein
MKKIILLTIASLFSLSTFAQSDTGKTNDTLKIKWKNSRIWIFDAEKKICIDTLKKPTPSYSKSDYIHWGGLDLGISMLTTASNQFLVSDDENIYNTNYFLDLKYNRSWYYSLNFWEKGFRLSKNNLMLVTGLGIEWDSYNFRNNILLDPKADNTNSSTIQIDTSSTNRYIKNQLKAAYVKMPVLLQFNTNSSNPNKSFHFAVGAELGYKIDSWIKQKIENEDYTYKIKHHADYNLGNFKYGLALRAGYGDFTFFANYIYSPLFDKEKGPEKAVFPLAAGISIGF